DGLIRVLESIHDGRIETAAIDTPEPSPFSHEILNSNPYAYLDDAPLEERRARAVQMRRTLPADYAEGAAALDREAIAQVAAEAWPLMRDPDELHEALCGLSLMPPGEGEELQVLYKALAESRRAAAATIAGRQYWVAAERIEIVRRVYPSIHTNPPLAAPQGMREAPESPEACAAEILRGWFECSGPLRATELTGKLALPRDLVDQALAQLEAEGQILRGRFTGAEETEWCHRRLLARIHRLTIGRLRREIEPVSTAQFFAFLNRWQHLSPGSQLHAVDGTLQIIRQLQGCEFPAAAWE